MGKKVKRVREIKKNIKVREISSEEKTDSEEKDNSGRVNVSLNESFSSFRAPDILGAETFVSNFSSSNETIATARQRNSEIVEESRTYESAGTTFNESVRSTREYRPVDSSSGGTLASASASSSERVSFQRQGPSSLGRNELAQRGIGQNTLDGDDLTRKYQLGESSEFSKVKRRKELF